jgi:hypothetical protein
MTIKELAKQQRTSEKLLRTVARIAEIDTSHLTGADIRVICIGLAVARDTNVQRQIICRYSKRQKDALIRTAGLTDRLEVWLYSRMESIMNSDRRVRLHAILHEASKFFACSITPALRHKARKVRQRLYNKRKYQRRKLWLRLEGLNLKL